MSVRTLSLALLLLGAGPLAALPPNEQPMFGEAPKTQAMEIADAQFIAAAAAYGTRPQTSDRSVALGWRYFFEKHDIAGAMKRFNQAWLLDPDNGDAFHGFAILTMERDHDAQRADALFRQGIGKPRQSPGIYLDYGRFLLQVKRPADAVVQLRKALGFPAMGPDAPALLVLALSQSGDQAAACAARAQLRDGAQPAILGEARAVTASCPRPTRPPF